MPNDGEGEVPARDRGADRLLRRMDLPPIREGHRAVAVPPGLEPPSSRPDPATLRVFTLPNLISVLRIVLVPIFVWQLVGHEAYALCLAILVIGGASDWVDGKIARMWGMESRLGAMLDPVADRLFIAVVPISFALVGIIPWWVVALLLGRDVLLVPTLLVYRTRGMTPDVLYVGKMASFALMYAFPLILAVHAFPAGETWLAPPSLALLVWGAALYLWTGLVYWWRAILAWCT